MYTGQCECAWKSAERSSNNSRSALSECYKPTRDDKLMEIICSADCVRVDCFKGGCSCIYTIGCDS